MMTTRLKNGNTRVEHDGKRAIWGAKEQRFIFDNGVYRPELERARRELSGRIR